MAMSQLECIARSVVLEGAKTLSFFFSFLCVYRLISGSVINYMETCVLLNWSN